MIGQVLFYHQGLPRPAYVLDCLGNLVRCSAEGNPTALVPFAVELVSPASELANPYPWTVTIEKLVSRLEFVAEALPVINSVYPEFKVPQLAFPFVPCIDLMEAADLVAQAIEIFPGLAADEAVLVQEKLAENGVFPIPAAASFLPSIHEAVGDGICVPPIAYVTAGWMSATKVYQKALVRSA